MIKLIFYLLFFPIFVNGNDLEPDSLGYIMYCPCMGRFGNQADHFLGALAFSKALNRTLVVPPWVEYRKGEIHSYQIPFDTYFKFEPLQEYHKVILMHDFMEKFASKIWPPNLRTSFCYLERQSLDKENKKKDCNAKDGNPFGPFWNQFSIDFISSEFFGPLHFDVHHSDIAEKWKEKYSPTEWPVLAFTGAPASFPVQLENRELHRYLKWNDLYLTKAKEYIKKFLPKGAFIGIHLRNGIDWVRACEHVKRSEQLFASPQCLGYNNEMGQLYAELCFPTKVTIIKQLKRVIKKVRELKNNNEIRSIFIASDANHLINELSPTFSRMNITLHKLPKDNSHLDLAILGLSNYFIGNCISSYSAFVKRERDVKGFPSYFWSFPKDRSNKTKINHDEL